MTRTKWIIFIVIALSILGLLVFTSKKNNTSTFNGDPAKMITEGPIADHIFGSNAGKVTLIEFADFQCPGCESVYPMIKQIKERYKADLTFIFRNMPLTTIHPNALAAATAAEAAGLQGKFYEYHNLLYDNQSAWKDATGSNRTNAFESYAQGLGLDLNKFRADLSSAQITDKINRDRSTASRFSVTSTPTLILNGQKVPQDATFDPDKLMQLLDDEYKKAGLAPPSNP